MVGEQVQGLIQAGCGKDQAERAILLEEGGDLLPGYEIDPVRDDSSQFPHQTGLIEADHSDLHLRDELGPGLPAKVGRNKLRPGQVKPTERQEHSDEAHCNDSVADSVQSGGRPGQLDGEPKCKTGERGQCVVWKFRADETEDSEHDGDLHQEVTSESIRSAFGFPFLQSAGDIPGPGGEAEKERDKIQRDRA